MPKTRQSLRGLVELKMNKKDDAEMEKAVELLGHVYFQVHPQQVNIRDKANGKLIVSIRK
ncbi:MAG: hypothetical protein WAN47_08720 [Nitrosotalea sp.]